MIMNKQNKKIAVSGATGLVGSDLIKLLKLTGHSTLTLSRRNEGVGSILWDPAKGVTPPEALEGIDSVVHLAGENIAGSREKEREHCGESMDSGCKRANSQQSS